MTVPYYRASVRLELMTDREPDANGYVRTDADTVAETVVTAPTEEHAVKLIAAHVDVMRCATAPLLSIGGTQS